MQRHSRFLPKGFCLYFLQVPWP